MGLFDWRRLSPEHWLADTVEPIDHPAYLVLAVVQTLVFAASVGVHLLAEPLLADRPAVRRIVARVATVAGVLAAVGLVVLLVRWQPVPFLSKRIWLYLWWVGVAVAAGRATWGARRRVSHGTVTA